METKHYKLVKDLYNTTTSLKNIVKELNDEKLKSSKLKYGYYKRKITVLLLECLTNDKQLKIQYLKNKLSRVYKEKYSSRGNRPKTDII